MNIDFRHINEWSLKKQSMIFLIIFLIVFYLGYSFDISGLQDDFFAAKKTEKELLQQINSAIEKQQHIKMDVDQLPRYEVLLNQWKARLVEPEKLSELLTEILKAGSDNHLVFADFNPEEKKQDNTYPMIPIGVVVVGTYHQIGNFLSQIANLPQMISIGDFTLSSETKSELLGKKLTAEATSQNLLTGIFNFQIYFSEMPLHEKK